MVVISSKIKHLDAIFIGHSTDAVEQHAACFIRLPFFDSLTDGLGGHVNSFQPHLQSISKEH